MSGIQHCFCGRLARFEIGKINRKNKEVQWLEVCGTCDSQLGIKNLVTLGHTRKEAEEINQKVKREGKKDATKRRRSND